MDDAEDLSYVDVAVLICADVPQSKTKLMHRVIDIYGDMIEHGPYLYGEYSDDVDEAMSGMCSWGALADWCITEYGKDLLEAVRQITDDEDIIKVLERSP